MKTQNIQITQTDLTRLQNLLRDLPSAQKASREALAHELQRATVVPSDAIPPNVITLHSRARLRDLETGEVLDFTVVMPEGADVERGCISILAPLGTAMLGYQTGDTFEWQTPGGLCRFQVEEVLFQPEASGGAEAGRSEIEEGVLTA